MHRNIMADIRNAYRRSRALNSMCNRKGDMAALVFISVEVLAQLSELDVTDGLMR